MKTRIIFAIVALVIIIICKNIFFNSKVHNKVNAHNILEVKPGMSLEQVFKILGKPLKIEALRGVHDINCSNPNFILVNDVNDKTDVKQIVNDFILNKNYCCETNKEDIKQFNNITLVYTKERHYTSYPMLWIHLDKSCIVKSIYAKEYEEGFIADDLEIYSYSYIWDFDPTCLDKTKTEKLINKKKFFLNFK